MTLDRGGKSSLKSNWLRFCLFLLVSLLLAFVLTGAGKSINACEDNYITSYIRLESEKDLYYPGEQVEIDLVLVNQSPETVTHVMAHNVKIYDADENIIWEEDFVIYGKMILEPHSEALLGVFVWAQKDKDDCQVESGTYKISVRLWQEDVEGEKIIRIEEKLEEKLGISKLFDFLSNFFHWFFELWS